MNQFIAKFAGIVLLVLSVFVVTGSTGCHKNQKCKAVITCLDANGSPMAGATVKCTNADVDITASTDGSGTASFETDLPMILDILVNGNPTGRVARFEEGQTDNVTVQ